MIIVSIGGNMCNFYNYFNKQYIIDPYYNTRTHVLYDIENEIFVDAMCFLGNGPVNSIMKIVS